MTSMNKLVWQYYWKSFRWKRVWRMTKEVTDIGWVVWFFLVTTKDSFLNIFGMVIIFFAILSALSVELQLPKQMYLVPLTGEERREYMEKLLRLKIIFPNVVLLLVIGGMILVRLGHWSVGIMLIIQNVVTTMNVSFYYKKKLPNKTWVVFEKGGKSFFSGVFWGMTLESALLTLFFENVIAHRDGWILFGIVLLVQIFFLCRRYSHKNQYFDTMVDYERTWEKATREEIETLGLYQKQEEEKKNDKYEGFDIYNWYE